MKKYSLIILFLVFSSTLVAQGGSFGDDEKADQYYFGFNLVPSAGGGLTHFALVRVDINGDKHYRQLTKDQFVRQVTGEAYSKANPNGVDLLKRHKIMNPDIINELWKLRYVDYAFGYPKAVLVEGWSTNDSLPFIPSPPQMEMLAEFGITRMNDFCMGDNAFELLKSMETPEWLNQYREIYE